MEQIVYGEETVAVSENGAPQNWSKMLSFSWTLMILRGAGTFLFYGWIGSVEDNPQCMDSPGLTIQLT